MKKMLFLFTMIFTMVVCSCGESFLDEEAKTPTPTPTPRDTMYYWVPLDTTTFIVVDRDSNYIAGPIKGLLAWVRTQPTLKAQGLTPWRPAESLRKNVSAVADTASFEYIYGSNTIGYGLYEVEYKNRAIGLYHPQNMSLRGKHSEIIEIETPKYYSESQTLYSLCYSETPFAYGIQNFIAEEEYELEFVKMLLDKFHVGPATASYADGQANILCPDSVIARWEMNDGTYQNWFRAVVNSINTYSVSYSGTEVESIDALDGKTLTVKDNQLTYKNGEDDFQMTVNHRSRGFVENRLDYSCNGNTINLIDKLTACGYHLNGGQFVMSQVRVDMVHDSIGHETVSFMVPIPFKEKIRLLREDTVYTHIGYDPMASVNGNLFFITAHHTVEITKHFSDGTTETRTVSYHEKLYYKLSGEMEVLLNEGEDILGRYTLTNGQATIGNKNYSVEYVKSECSDKQFNGKYTCQANPQAIIIENDKLIIESLGDHDDDNSIINAEFPFSIIYIVELEGNILFGITSDSYPNQVGERETYDHIVTYVAPGHYNHYYRVYGEKKLQKEVLTSIGNLAQPGVNAAWWYDLDMNHHLGSVEAVKIDGGNKESYMLTYKDKDGNIQYYLGNAEKTLSDLFRYPVVRTLEKVVKGAEVLWSFNNNKNKEFFTTK